MASQGLDENIDVKLQGNCAGLGRPWMGRVPLLVAAAAICFITAWNLVRLVTAQAPRNPWRRPRLWKLVQHEGSACLRIRPCRPCHTHVRGVCASGAGRVVSLVRAEQRVRTSFISGFMLLTVTLIAIVMRSGRSVFNLACAVSWARPRRQSSLGALFRRKSP